VHCIESHKLRLVGRDAANEIDTLETTKLHLKNYISISVDRIKKDGKFKNDPRSE
jgi:hypothetical protein